MIKLLFFLGLAFVCSSCGYRFDQNKLSEYKTVSIPYVSGDPKGELTACLVENLSTLSSLRYTQNCGDLYLNVKVLDTKFEEIDYTRAVDFLTGQEKKQTEPIEDRLSILVQVSLTETKTGKAVMDPIVLSTSVNYNYDSDFNQTNLVPFSLGQYNFRDEARRYAHKPLYDDISHAIINYINSSW